MGVANCRSWTSAVAAIDGISQSGCSCDDIGASCRQRRYDTSVAGCAKRCKQAPHLAPFGGPFRHEFSSGHHMIASGPVLAGADKPITSSNDTPQMRDPAPGSTRIMRWRATPERVLFTTTGRRTGGSRWRSVPNESFVACRSDTRSSPAVVRARFSRRRLARRAKHLLARLQLVEACRLLLVRRCWVASHTISPHHNAARRHRGGQHSADRILPADVMCSASASPSRGRWLRPRPGTTRAVAVHHGGLVA